MNKIAESPHSDPRRREAARFRLLEQLRRQGPQSRATLGRMVGMSPASMTGLISGLIAENILVDTGVEFIDANSGPGRPGTLVGFNPDLGRLIGLWVGLDRIALHMTDFSGRTLAAREEMIAISKLETSALVAALAQRIDQFREENGAGCRYLGLGVAFQGFVDRSKGRVVWSPVTPNTDIPLAALLAEATGLPVELDNDASAMAYAITCSDPLLQNGVTACVMLGDGVGMGVFIDGKPLRGPHGGGIEFGHIPLSPDGPQCRCGARGCVESYLADYALYRDALAVASDLSSLPRRQPGEGEMAYIVTRADSGDKAMIGLLENAGRMLSQGIATLIHLFQPRSIVFCGPGIRAWHHIERGMLDGLRRYAIPGLARDVAISSRPFQTEFLTQGIILSAMGTIDRKRARITS